MDAAYAQPGQSYAFPALQAGQPQQGGNGQVTQTLQALVQQQQQQRMMQAMMARQRGQTLPQGGGGQ
jgi:hypothetical protein